MCSPWNVIKCLEAAAYESTYVGFHDIPQITACAFCDIVELYSATTHVGNIVARQRLNGGTVIAVGNTTKEGETHRRRCCKSQNTHHNILILLGVGGQAQGHTQYLFQPSRNQRCCAAVGEVFVRNSKLAWAGSWYCVGALKQKGGEERYGYNLFYLLSHPVH